MIKDLKPKSKPFMCWPRIMRPYEFGEPDDGVRKLMWGVEYEKTCIGIIGDDYPDEIYIIEEKKFMETPGSELVRWLILACILLPIAAWIEIHLVGG